MPSKRRFILVPAGSAGDILPFVWLGQHLAAAGHDVLAVVHEPLGRLFHDAGLHTSTHGTAEEFDALLRHPDLWHPQRGFPLIARMADRWYRQAVPRIQEAIRPGYTTLVGAGIAFAARIAAEAFKLPLVTVQLQPMAFLSVEAPPLLRPNWEWFATSPLWFRRLVFKLVAWKTDWLLAEGLNNYRGELGLGEPVRRVMETYWVSPQRVIALFPTWFAPRAADWPVQTVHTRFPLYDGAETSAWSPQLEEFLQAGAPPILFTPGSANLQARGFFESAAAACRQLGLRGLLLSPYAAQVPTDLPPSIRWFPSAPFSRLFPRCRLVVHHGGIGTVAQGLAAGTPQLLMPMSHDQPDNALRLKRLGVGDYLLPAHFQPDTVVDRIRSLTGSKEVARHCHDLRDRMRAQMAPEDVTQLIAEIS